MAMIAQPLAAAFVIALVIVLMTLVRAFSVFVVGHFGVTGGLVALAAMFSVGYLLRD